MSSASAGLIKGRTSKPRVPNDLTVEGLKKKEKIRRALLVDAKVASPIRLAFAWTGTVLPRTIKSVTFWFNVILYGVIRFLIRYQGERGLITSENDIPLPNLGIMGGLMSFFLVFYASQTYGRFVAQYDGAMACEGRIFDVCSVAQASEMSYEEKLRLHRYINLAHILAYVGLSDVYSHDNFLTVFNDEYRVMTEDEIARLTMLGTDLGGSCYREAITWALKHIRNMAKQDKLSGNQEFGMQSNILALRGKLASAYDFSDQPIPFMYIHLIYMMTTIYLPLFSYTTAAHYGLAHNDDGSMRTPFVEVVGAIQVCLVLTFVLGIRILGQKMSDPFGDDVEDLSIIHYVTFTYKASLKIIRGAKFPMSPESELKLDQARDELGAGFAAPVDG